MDWAVAIAPFRLAADKVYVVRLGDLARPRIAHSWWWQSRAFVAKAWFLLVTVAPVKAVATPTYTLNFAQRTMAAWILRAFGGERYLSGEIFLSRTWDESCRAGAPLSREVMLEAVDDLQEYGLVYHDADGGCHLSRDELRVALGCSGRPSALGGGRVVYHGAAAYQDPP